MMLQLIIGTPNSGKSTFIAALRHLLLADEVPTQLELSGLAEDETHLNRLETEWLACERVQRTNSATEGWVQLHIKDRTSGVQSELSIPDLRGEAFEQPVCSGQCRTELLSALVDCDGILLFLNADREDDTVLLDDLTELFGAGVTPGEDLAVLEPPMPFESFRPENMPEEVKIVEFLQVANRRPRSVKKRRIAVLVSAWDVVDETSGMTPELWMFTQRPMLAQFLEANDDIWDTRIYGVSAQGGRLPAKKEDLEKIDIPSKRVRIVGHAAANHDLSAPLQWLISFGGENGA